MSNRILLPPLNDPAIKVIVEQYYVAVDDPVVAGQPFALVRSERFAWDVPATTGGVISALLIEPGSTVAPGTALMALRDEQPTTNHQPTTDNEQQQIITEQQRDAVATPAAQRVRATPVARRMIAAHGLDPAALTGTGRGNVVTRTDVLAVLGTKEQGTTEQGNAETINKQSAMLDDQTKVNLQRSTSDVQPSNLATFQPVNMPTFQRSELPYALTAIDVDLAAALATTNQHAERWARRGVTISITACVAATTVAALGEHRLLNSAWSDDGIILRSRVHLQIEHRTPAGMQTVLVPDAADLNLVGIARRLAHTAQYEVIKRQAATFVIVEHAAPWWAHPMPDGTCSAQLGVGAIVQQPRVVATAHGEEIMVRPTMVLTLAYDARVAAQPDADALLCAIKQWLEHLHSL